MRSRLLPFALAAALAVPTGLVHAEAPPAYIGKHVSTAADTAAIRQVISDFQTAIRTHDVKLLSTLVLHSNILFDSPETPAVIAKVRDKFDASYDGLRSGGFHAFSRFIGQSKDALEEKFYDVKITQDNNVAWVMFDYEFVMNGKSTNYGVETWQMMQNAEGKWKIASVMWTTTFLP